MYCVKKKESKKRKKIISGILVIAIFALSACKSDDTKLSKTMEIKQLHNGDAKFYNDDILTNVNGVMAIYNTSGEQLKTYSEVAANWLSCISEEGIIVYGNFNQQIGVVKLDENYNIESNQIIMTTENLQIDPTIIKVNNTYYITVTEIEGNVNNADPSQENGNYTIHLYSSSDLVNWNYVSKVVEMKNNLEDVDIFFQENHFYVTYEQEVVDKGNSSICLIESEDESGSTWGEPRELLPADCDHEPASWQQIDDGYRLYYSCDLKNEGESYMGGNIFYADFDKEYNLVKKDNEISTVTSKGILLYDVEQKQGKNIYLYAKDYLADCDMVIEQEK